MAAKLSGSDAGKFGVDANHDINVTPFVDVMLVLLIIFMVAAPLETVDVKVNLPPAVAKPSPNPNKPVYITIQRDGALHIGDFTTSLDTLGPDLKKATTGRDPTQERIFVRGDKDTIYGDFMNVMNKLQDNGFYSVALVGTDQGSHTH